MEFDKSRVYTALNADELKVGSKVVVASNIGDLKDRVAIHDDKYVTEIVTIEDEQTPFRFTIDDTDSYVGTHWSLAYLVSEPGAIRCADLKIGDVVSDGFTDFMVIGVDRSDDEVFLPRLEWVSDADLTRYHKKDADK